MVNMKLLDDELENVTGGIDLVYRGDKIPATTLQMNSSVSPQPVMLIHTNGSVEKTDKQKTGLVSGGDDKPKATFC